MRNQGSWETLTCRAAKTSGEKSTPCIHFPQGQLQKELKNYECVRHSLAFKGFIKKKCTKKLLKARVKTEKHDRAGPPPHPAKKKSSSNSTVTKWSEQGLNSCSIYSLQLCKAEAQCRYTCVPTAVPPKGWVSNRYRSMQGIIQKLRAGGKNLTVEIHHYTEGKKKQNQNTVLSLSPTPQLSHSVSIPSSYPAKDL